jgi:hypothetical protein
MSLAEVHRQEKETLRHLINTARLARIKYGNLDPEVHEVLCAAEEHIAMLEGREYTPVPGRPE